MNLNLFAFPYKKCLGHFLSFFLASIGISLLITTPGIFIYFALDKDFFPMISTLVASTLFLFICIFFQNFSICNFAHLLSKNIRCSIFNKLLGCPIDTLDRISSNHYSIHIISDVFKFQELIELCLPAVVTHGSLLLFSLGMILWLTGKVMFLGLILPVLFLCLPKEIQDLQYQRLLQMGSYIYETLSQIRTIKILAHEEVDQMILDRYTDQIYLEHKNYAKKSALSFALFFLLVLTTLVFITIMGSDYIQKEKMTMGTLAAYFYYLSLMMIAFYSLGKITSKVRALLALSKQLGVYSKPFRQDTKIYKQLRMDPVRGLIALHNVSFAYPKVTSQTILHDINLSIYPNEIIAIIGPSGAGKSTLLNLLLGLYEPQKGKIYLDGIAIQDLSTKDLLNQISIVDQEPELFSASIYENILYGNPGICESEAQQILDLVFPQKWQDQFPKGLHTMVGPRGYGLSVGQKQCIALGRALIRGTQILLLDEATSGLDNETEAHITHNIFPFLKVKTTIMVTHKISSILNADKVILMQAGKIVSMGTHEELYQKNLLYRRLLNAEIVTKIPA